MPEPPLLSPALLIKILEGEGYRWRRSRGTDQAYKRAAEGSSRTVIVPTHRREIPRGTMRSIMRQAGWSLDELLALVRKYR